MLENTQTAPSQTANSEIELQSRITQLEIENSKLLAENISLRLENQSLSERAQKAFKDPLTGVYNRGFLDETLSLELAAAARTNTPTGLIFLDIDKFKQYNDAFGHQAGDDALKAFAYAISCVIHRDADFVARYGGEEFVVVLPATDPEGTYKVADRLWRTFNNMLKKDQEIVIPRKNGERHPPEHLKLKRDITASIGFSCGYNMKAETLIEQADHMSYVAKSKGRNRIGNQPHRPSQRTK